MWAPQACIAWLEEQSSDTLHDIALAYDWGSPGLEPLQAIIEHPLCDRSTSMFVFSYATPLIYEGLLSRNGAVDKLQGIDIEIVNPDSG